MRKTEFLDQLRISLSGRLSADAVAENLNYYEDYINTKIRLGSSEEEVMKSLGDPRLIAKTIVGTSELGQEKEENITENYNSEYEDRDVNGRVNKRWRLPAWAWIVIVVLIIIILLGIVFSILSFLLPILFPIVVVLFLVKLFRDWLN